MLEFVQVKAFFSNRFNLYLVIGLLLLGGYLIVQPFQPEPPSTESVDGEVVLHFYYLPTCPHCADQKEFHVGLLERHPNLTIISHDVSYPHEQTDLAVKLAERGLLGSGLPTPVTVIGEQMFIGFDESVGEQIESKVEELEGSKESKGVVGKRDEEPDFTPSIPFVGEIYLLDYSLPVVAIILGLVDGFNPCAMWVLVFLLIFIQIVYRQPCSLFI